MSGIGQNRRLAIAAISLGCAAILFHSNVATALISRGDELLAQGDTNGATLAYARALAFDGASLVAADRLAFGYLLRRAPGDAERAFTTAGAALSHSPGNASLATDLGLAAERLGRWNDAERSFLSVAASSNDARYAHLAAECALRRHDITAARSDLRRALMIDHTYSPARYAIRRLAS
jgi:tetratricopeptide (TPR) repeat protein